MQWDVRKLKYYEWNNWSMPTNKKYYNDINQQEIYIRSA